MMAALRIGAKIAAALLLVLVAVVGAAWGVVQARPVKDWLQAQLTAALSGPERTVTIGRIRGGLPFELRLAELRVADRDGDWLAAKDIAVDLRARDLLRGRLTIARLAAADIRIARAPAADPAAPPPPSGPLKLPELPRLPVDVDLQRLDIGLLQLGAPVLGEEVIVTSQGRAALVDGTADAQLSVRRIDAQPGAAMLLAKLADGRLSIDAHVSEPSGLLLARLLERDDRPPLDVTFAGDGPLADWHGRLTGRVGQLGRIDAELGLAASEPTRLTLGGHVAAAPLLAPEIAKLVGDDLPFAAAATIGADGKLGLEELRIDAAAARLRGTGWLEPRSGAVAAELSATLPDLAVPAGAFGAPAGGSATVELSVSGTMDRPVVALGLDGHDLAYQEHRIGHAAARIEARPSGSLTDPATLIALAGDGRLEGVAPNGAAAPAGLGEAIDWHIAGSSDTSGDKVALDALHVAAPGVTLDGSGTIAGQGAAVDVTLTGVAEDLARFAEIVGKPGLAGRARLKVAAKRDAADAPLTATLTATADGLATGIAAADALLGKHVDLVATASRHADGAMALETATLTAPQLRVAGKGSLAADGQMEGEATIDLPRLDALGPALGTPLSGRATLVANLDGTVDAPVARARLDGTGIASGARRIDRIEATLSVADPKQPAGKLEARLRAAELDARLAGEFALRDDGKTLVVPKLGLNAAGASVEATLKVALDTMLASGTIDGRVPDLKPWSALASTPLGGRIDLKATLGTKGGQSVDLALNGQKLTVGAAPDAETSLEKVAVTAHLADLLGKPSGKTEATLGRLVFGGGELAAARVTAESAKPGRFVIAAETRGTVPQPVQVGLGAEATLAAGALDLRVTKLAGQFARQDFALRRPLVLSKHGNDLAFSQLQLALGPGELTGEGALRASGVKLAVAATALPIGFFARLAGQDEVEGKLGFEIDLSGPLADPRGRVLVQGSELHFAAASHPEMPPLRLVAEARWQDQRIELRGRVAAPNDEAIGFSAAAPLRLRQHPLGVELPPDGAIAAKLEGAGKLENLADLLPLGEDRLAGAFFLDASVSGTVANPVAGGKVTLSKGRYESLAAGAVLSDIAVELAGDRDRFVLRRFSAKDGAKGTLGAQGAVVLSATPGPAIDFAATLKSFRAARRDEGTATLSGDIKVGGTVGAPAIQARLRIDQAEIRVPDKMPPHIAKLEVVEVDSRTGRAVVPAKPKAKEPALPATLDIVIDAPNQIFVRGRGLDSEWKGHVVVKGTSAEPVVIGQLEVVRGTFSFLGKSFALTQGTIGFDGGTQIDPTLDITAQVRSSDVTAQVVIGGRASEPTVKLTSTPELPQDEVLARVLFNRSIGQLSPAQGVQLASAAATLAGGGPGILDRVRGRLGLDRLDIGSADDSGRTGTAGQNAGAGGTTVSAGKYIAEGVYVGVDQSVSGQSKAKVEVEIAPNFSVGTDVGGQGGGQGLGLNWKMDY